MNNLIESNQSCMLTNLRLQNMVTERVYILCLSAGIKARLISVTKQLFMSS